MLKTYRQPLSITKNVCSAWRHFCLFFPDLCRPGVWCDELDHSLGGGAVLFRRTERLHPGGLEVSHSILYCDTILFLFSCCRHWSSLPGVLKVVFRGLQRRSPPRLPVHDPRAPLHTHPCPALQCKSTTQRSSLLLSTCCTALVVIFWAWTKSCLVF